MLVNCSLTLLPLVLTCSLLAEVRETLDRPPSRHGGCLKHILKWNPDKALYYTEHLENNTEGHNSFMKAIERKDIEAANNYLRAMIISAACTSGMGKFSPCGFLSEESKGGSWSQKGSLV